MSRWKKILLGLLITILVIVGLFILVVGPWPVYESSNYAEQGYFKQALADIDSHAAANDITATPGRLQAGWSYRIINPPDGSPLGGYGARGITHHSTGVHDDLYVKTLALSDGKDTIVLVGADMLITPPAVSRMVREMVAEQVPALGPDDILFNASHTHCGPGGFGKGLAMRVTGGQFVEELPGLLAKAYTDAIVEAYKKLAPAKLAHGSVDAPDYIRNRARSNNPVDSELSFAVVEQDAGDRCYLVSYSAHPTNYGEDMMQYSAEYPGQLRKYIERQTQAGTVYLGGAVGSMGPRSPEAASTEARVEAMGTALAQLVLDHSKDLEFKDTLDIASVGIKLGMPPVQLRPFEENPNWRLSPILAKLAFAPNEMDGWIHGARVGNLVFMGMPCDFCGEISREWKAWAQNRGYDLWNLSFCSTYCGYFSPDKYYKSLPLGYETGFMSWFGPDIEAYMTDLFEHIVAALAPPDQEIALAQ